MQLSHYLNQFTAHRRITLVGPMQFDLSPMPSLEPIIWIDGGAKHRPADGVGFAVGDGDSCDAKLDEYLDPHKDFSDLAFVLRNLSANFTEIVLHGFLGGRRDHELFNFGEVHHFLKGARAATSVRFDDSVCAYSAGEWRLHCDGVFSLAVLESATVQLRGECKYRIERPAKLDALSSFGLSNIGEGEIKVESDAPFFIFHCDKA